MTTTTSLGELTGDYVIDATRTRIGFVGRHTMATRVRGWFDAFEGGAHLDGDDPSKSDAELTIQAGSVRTGDRRRDAHLRGRFLDADGHPAITFASTGVVRAGEVFRVTGDLTIRGVTRPVTVDFRLTGAGNDPEGGFRVGFAGGVTIDRDDWGVNWNAVTGVLISGKVTLQLEVSVVRRRGDT
ncbi:polyisoprenoid-binding protein [Nonomuraea terrae]|uniref:Polyisoprenoid-binding protein n=1 Tax=Nonomuraea terrae TaxID=2530383 RepID=A0A4R4ZFI5_9ACTN|nr:YceI family protein [Nonomuraea terrae]TDD57253.1 polyisoprenoid-binding protein [Nonomuraea terrae]